MEGVDRECKLHSFYCQFHRMFKDPLVRRLISASFFAAAFVWVAVRYFNVETEVVRVLFLLSFVFVGVLMVAGLILFPTVRLFRRSRTSLLSSIDAPAEAEKEEATRSSTSE